MSWEEMLLTFQELGGVAENIYLSNGNYGRGVFSLDPNSPSKIQLPENLLIDSKWLSANTEEIVLKNDSPYDQKTKDFINLYLKIFSFTSKVKKQINEFEKALSSLPPEVLTLLRQLGALNLKIRHKESWEEVIFQHFIQSRFVDYNGGKCLAPVFELVNHDPQYPVFKTGSGISTFKKEGDSEFLHSYSKGNDPIRMFFGYGFSSKEPFAFSLPITITLSKNHKPIRIKGGCGIEGLIPIEERENELILDYLPIGNKFDPTFPIRQLTATLKPFHEYHQARELLNQGLTANQEQICNLLLLLNKSENALPISLRETLYYQLSAMGFSW